MILLHVRDISHHSEQKIKCMNSKSGSSGRRAGVPSSFSCLIFRLFKSMLTNFHHWCTSLQCKPIVSCPKSDTMTISPLAEWVKQRIEDRGFTTWLPGRQKTVIERETIIQLPSQQISAVSGFLLNPEKPNIIIYSIKGSIHFKVG